MITNNLSINNFNQNYNYNNSLNFKSDKVIYVCSRLASGYRKSPKHQTIRDFIQSNMAKAMNYAKQIVKKGDFPYWNHSTWPNFVDDTKPKERNIAIKGCLDLVSRCEALVYFGKPIGGMKQEIDKAKNVGMVVLSSKEYFKMKPKNFDKLVEDSPHYKKLRNALT